MKSNVAHLQAIHRLPNVLPIRIHPQRKSETIAYHMKRFPRTKYFQNVHVSLFTACHVEQLGAESTLYITVNGAVLLYQTSTWPWVAVPDTSKCCRNADCAAQYKLNCTTTNVYCTTSNASCEMSHVYTSSKWQVIQVNLSEVATVVWFMLPFLFYILTISYSLYVACASPNLAKSSFLSLQHLNVKGNITSSHKLASHPKKRCILEVPWCTSSQGDNRTDD